MIRKLTYCILILCFLPSVLWAETIKLRSGQKVTGTVLFENEEVIVLKDAEGMRFQYPKTEIKERLDADEPDTEENDEKASLSTPKKASLRLDISCGAATANTNWAFGINTDVLVGTTNLLDKNIFLGGGLGYHTVIGLENNNYSFLPIQLATSIPLMKNNHAPFLGLNVGYGIALAKQYNGGLFSGVDFGYRYQLVRGGAIFVGANASFQMAKIVTTEIIDEVEYLSKKGTTFCTMGVKFAIQF